MAKNIEEFSEWYPMVLFLSCSLIYSTLLKILFNAFAMQGIDNRVPYDRWAIMDTLSALVTIIGFPIIIGQPPESMVLKE